jgi:uncharacterized protein YdhG (YjbR/CyaY superfamily)
LILNTPVYPTTGSTKISFLFFGFFSLKYFFNQIAGSVKIPERTCLDLDRFCRLISFVFKEKNHYAA